MKAQCQICGNDFDMGYNGTIDGCDNCTGFKRDSKGHFWEPGETEHVYQNPDGTLYTITLEEAFR